jgi:hypothetical protein
MDALLTFVVPALVYSTDSALAAFAAGVRFVGFAWPGSMLYVLMPGLTMRVISSILPSSDTPGAVDTLVAVMSGLLAFATRGIVAPFYLRHLERVAGDGAA